MSLNSPYVSDSHSNKSENPFAATQSQPKKRNWFAIIGMILGFIVVAPFALMIGAIFCLALIASIGAQARKEPTATEAQSIPVSVRSEEVAEGINANESHN